MRRRRKRRPLEAEIPTSSTGDIAFLLIIFFMVTATFATTQGLSFQLPDNEPQGEDGDESVLIEISGDGTVTVDCTVMNATMALDYLEPKLNRNPQKPVILYSHESADYQQLVYVYEWLFRAPERGMETPNIQITTPGDIEKYIEAFGRDPFREHCSTSG